MFGYVNVNDKLEEGQRGLWQTFMCGLCFSTKELFGNLPRMFISNDINFFNVLFHSVEEVDVELEKSRCFSHPVKKRTVLKQTELTHKLSVANIILTYFNIYDDVIDGGGLKKKTALSAYSKPYKKAKNLWAEMDEAIALRYEQLRQLEKENCDSIDRVAHSFASLSQDFCKLVLGEHCSEHAETLCYNVGKWIFLIDALDDAAKDLKKRNYNAFVSCYHAQSIEDVQAHLDEISFLMFAVLNRIAQSFNDLNLTKYVCVLKNVLFESIREKTQQVLDKLRKEIK